LRSLAFLMYENGDIDRAYKYIKLVWCSFVMRAYEPTKYRRCCPLLTRVSKKMKPIDFS
jgi:hypothetical protein